MPTVTISIPADLKKKMNQIKEMNWSAVARQAIEEKVHALELMNHLLRNSELTETDVETAAREINKKLVKHYKLPKKG